MVYALDDYLRSDAPGIAAALGRLVDAPDRRAELASAKELVGHAIGRTLVAQLTLERDHLLENLFHPNGGEGLQAFIEKRAPRFR